MSDDGIDVSDDGDFLVEENSSSGDDSIQREPEIKGKLVWGRKKLVQFFIKGAEALPENKFSTSECTLHLSINRCKGQYS